MPIPIKKQKDIRPGDYYEDCAFHPCLCTRVEGDEINGVSLVDGSYPRGCSIGFCAVRKLSFEEALHWKYFGPKDRTLDDKSRWWYDYPKHDWLEVYRL